MLAEFRQFLLKTNALALAFGVIIGAALGGVVSSLVDDIIMPPVGVLLGGVDFASFTLKLKDAVGDKPEVVIRYGQFLNTVITFAIVALVVFWLSRVFFKPAATPPAPATKECPFCREAVPAAATKCRACTSAL